MDPLNLAVNISTAKNISPTTTMCLSFTQEPEAMKLPHIILLLTIFISSIPMAAPAPSYSKPGCTDTCGNITLPYPFGMGPNCFLNKWYAVDCINSSKPFLSALNNLPLLAVDLTQQMVLVNLPMTSACNTTQILNLAHTPFLFSKLHNRFIVQGCGTGEILSDGNMHTGCSTICSQECGSVNRSYCDGINCCQTSIPYYMDMYSVNVTASGESCVSAFLVADNSYVDELFSGRFVAGNGSLIAVVLRWTLSDNEFSEAGCGYNFSRHELKKGSDRSVNTVKCSCESELEEGNPYLSGGCKVPEECKKCMEGWEEYVGNYCIAVCELGRRILESISESLGLEKERLNTILGEQGQHMAINYYPLCPEPELTYGLPGHTDPNALTMLLQDTLVSGLQVQKDGKWVAVKPHPNAFVINIGDQLEALINGEYKSAWHRAVVNSDHSYLYGLYRDMLATWSGVKGMVW
ncbi:putative flavanone 3-dioxygenase [Helianthus annuus]|uniref:Flavanone 3-dioxygenase n=1 Tax=Helianthus annuus TaxID=4232 RepID=A0A9K3H6S1_HELAN|nr:putative flavanone 3-dioxygenase [Helianthus annuus]KAJ0839572.1 putative flavanone 3-dioxygenase [Helianthus annuus]